MPLLSIIIPSHNTPRETIHRALDSLLPLSDLCKWEAWIIDDGSTEGDLEAWINERNDEHLHYLWQENQRQGGARNNGIEHAKGRYIAFLDADDELIFPAFADIVEMMKQGRFEGIAYCSQSSTLQPFEGSPVTYMAVFDIPTTCWAYAINREALGSLRFTPGIYHEDEEFNTLLHLQLQNIAMTQIVAYRYHSTPHSTIHNRDAQHLKGRFRDLLHIIGKFQQLLPTLTGTARTALNHRIHVLAMCYVVNLMRDCDKPTRHELLSELQETALYPLPPFQGIKRYSLIRHLTCCPTLVDIFSPVVSRILTR